MSSIFVWPKLGVNSFLGTLLVLFLLGIQNADSSRCECTNKILMLLRYDDFRVIFSPDYPRTYCPDLTCAWRVVAPENYSQIHFFAKKIDMREDKDFIYFFESRTGMELDSDFSNATYSCTGKIDCQFKSSGQFLTIVFKSGSGFPGHYGFQGTVSLYDRQYTWYSSISNIFLIALVFVAIILLATVLAYFFICKRYIKKEKDFGSVRKDEETEISKSSRLGISSDVEASQKLVNP
ncbi:hypothetical protein FO519_006864 [Halicephalobus sp. NKZ332]|nr:hypothetical protein FO519_006864 [Halicephalobus sp. NKZ332]